MELSLFIPAVGTLFFCISGLANLDLFEQFTSGFGWLDGLVASLFSEMFCVVRLDDPIPKLTLGSSSLEFVSIISGSHSSLISQKFFARCFVCSTF